MNLFDIMQGAQSGQAMANLARQFGITDAQAQAAVNAMLPAFSVGLQDKARNPFDLSQMLAAMAGGAQQAAYTDPAATLNQSTLSAGHQILGQLFGQGQATAQIIAQVAKATGINPGILLAIMPVVATILMGGMFKEAANQGAGSVFGQLASRVLAGMAGAGGAGGFPGMGAGATNGPGGYGGMPGANPAGATAGPAGGLAGGWGGLFGEMANTMMGGAPAAGAQPGPAAPPPPGRDSAGAAPGAAPNPEPGAGLDVLTSMFSAGTQVQQAHANAIKQIFDAYSRTAPR